MEKIKDKFNKYGLAEWFLMIFGACILLVQGYKYTTNSLGEWKLEVAVTLVSFLFVRYPMLLADLIRKARGLEPKSNSKNGKDAN